MRATFLIISLGLILASCQENAEKSPDLRAVQSIDSVAFEIRDFKIETEAKTYGLSFTGRGTVVIKDSRFQNRSIFPFLHEKVTSKVGNIEQKDKSLVLNNGIGTIETKSFFGSDTPEFKQGGAPEYEWTVLGWTELKKGTLTVTK